MYHHSKQLFIIETVSQTQEEMPPAAEPQNRFQEKVPEDSILSDSLCEMLVQVRRQNPNKNQRQQIRKPFPNYNSKPALQQITQLLFECETKIVEDRNLQNQNSYKGLIMGSQEIGRIVCRNLKLWGKLSAHEKNIQQVLRMDLIEDARKYNDVWRKRIGREIGNGIFDEIIQEIITDLYSQY